MEKQKYTLIFKIISWVLMIVSVAVVVWGFIKGYPDKVAMTTVLLILCSTGLISCWASQLQQSSSSVS